jgi:hypothetical protein
MGGFQETTVVWNDVVDDIVNRERCTLSGPVVEVDWTIFSDIFHDGEGGAIFVDSRSLVSIRSDFFTNCTAGLATDATKHGGCAYLKDVLSGTRAFDSCATKCGSYGGSFVGLRVELYGADVELKGLSVFNCRSALGAVDNDCGRVNVSVSNFTRLLGKWTEVRHDAAAISQENTGGGQVSARTKGSSLLFATCSEGNSVFFGNGGDPAVLGRTS